MVIENAKTIVRYRLISLLISLVFILSITIILVSGYSNDTYFGISKYYYAIFLGSIYILYNIYVLLLNRNYFYFSDEGEKIEFRYYSTLPFSSSSRMIVIPKGNLSRYELKKVMGIKQELILYQKLSRGEAKYPPISLSALSSHEIQQLISSLDQLRKTSL